MAGKLTELPAGAIVTVTAFRSADGGGSETAKFALYRAGMVFKKLTQINGEPCDGNAMISFTLTHAEQQAYCSGKTDADSTARFLAQQLQVRGWTVTG